MIHAFTYTDIDDASMRASVVVDMSQAKAFVLYGPDADRKAMDLAPMVRDKLKLAARLRLSEAETVTLLVTSMGHYKVDVVEGFESLDEAKKHMSKGGI